MRFRGVAPKKIKFEVVDRIRFTTMAVLALRSEMMAARLAK